MNRLKFPWGVEGYLSPREGQELFRLACSIPDDRTIIELGCYKGRSAICMLQSGRQVISVDHFAGEALRPYRGIHPDHIAGDYYSAAVRNVDRLLPDARWLPLKANTSDRRVAEHTASLWGPVGMVFIDGDHSPAAVRADFETWEPLLADGGLMVFHDAQFPGPAQLIQSLVEARAWRSTGLVEAVRVLERIPAGVPAKEPMEVA